MTSPELLLRARWPALMSEEDAAEYLGVSVAQFRRERDAGIWPRPVDRGCRRNTYWKKRVDEAIERLNAGDHAENEIDLHEAFGYGGHPNSLSGDAAAR
jgi:hypothetical protein